MRVTVITCDRCGEDIKHHPVVVCVDNARPATASYHDLCEPCARAARTWLAALKGAKK